jgi:hypothetical protein
MKIIKKARSLSPEEGSIHRPPIAFRSKRCPDWQWAPDLVLRCTNELHPGYQITTAAQTRTIHNIFANVNPLEPIKRRQLHLDWCRDDPSLEQMTVIIGAMPNDGDHARCDFPPCYHPPQSYHWGVRRKIGFARTRYFFKNTVARHLGLTPAVDRSRPPPYGETIENHPTDDALFLASAACYTVSRSRTTFPVTIVGAPLPPDRDTAVARYPSLEGHDLEYLTHEEYLARVGAYRYSINVLEW